MFNKLKDCVVTNKVVFVRADMNVPIKNGKIIDDTRIKEAIPTIKYLVENGAKVILATHLGRPKGERQAEYSVKQILPIVKKMLPGVKVNWSNDCVGEQTKKDIENTNYGEVILLENLRFHIGEKKNDEKFARELASFANLYVNEAFSCCHRAHASMVGIPKILKGCVGFALEKETDNLLKLVFNPQTPAMVIVGGSKVSTKLALLMALIEKFEYIVVGGGMANTFLYALGKPVGKSLVEPELKDDALKLLDKAKRKGRTVILPSEVVVAKEVTEGQDVINVNVDDVAKDDIIVDVGVRTLEEIVANLEKCKTVIWNGPIGIYEIKPFNDGTDYLAGIIAKMTQSGKIKSVAGGGDILSALNKAGLTQDFSYVSTAGGAFLAWLEEGKLVALEVLKK